MSRKRKRTGHGWTIRKKKTVIPPEPPLPPSPPEPTTRSTHPHPQAQSLFFRLPAELRDQIYTDIFTWPERTHIAWVGGRGRGRKFRSFLCKVPEAKQLERTARGELCKWCTIDHFKCSTRKKYSGEVKVAPLPDEKAGVRVGAMLRCCRRVYNETIHTLYSRNTFYVENPRTLLEMSTRMPQPHLRLIPSLTLESPRFHRDYFDWDDERNMARWKAVVDALGKFEGLVELCIIVRRRYEYAHLLDLILKPVRAAEDAGAFAVAPRLILKGTDLYGFGELCSRHVDLEYPWEVI
ncbi:uncharacterized protein DSM5745_09749 [Aspergillus mulundensis]|uniref:DUF7730 domain-containing protein n=1 Tax=Aspergillus mulundensis TaxID=1810919 RepID=A0A3D8QRP4_9EURO|nr:hypothetical protein DSM5745_09749 [Aspergillus mulundensis]RDW64338.1 hypothetical protein DSM5745_09749 [Aspergillus mulundensis]